MCEQPKIHIFLGAPPPPSGLASVSEAEVERVDRPPAGWRHLELTWTDGHLKPATGNQEGSLREEGGTSREDAATDHSDDHRPAESSMNRDEESDPEGEEQCSASIHEYMDSCFPAAQPEQEQSEPGPEYPSSAAPPLCTRTQYLTTWTLSQTLILRDKGGTQSANSPEKTLPPQTPPKYTPPSTFSSTPELFSPVTPLPGASAELFNQCCSTTRVELGGVILEATTDGVLCSQEAGPTTTLKSPSKSPDIKRARISEDPRTEVPSNSTVARCQGPTTPLVQCNKPGVRYSILVAVVHPCHLKEVKVKSTPSVPLASIVVTDQSDVEMKVVLWRRAAFWVLTVSPGDILLITGLQVNEDRWRGETILQSTFSSKLLSLGQVTASASPPGSQHVNACSLSTLYGFLRERRPLLVSLPRHPPQDLKRLPYATLRSLRVNMLVHALLCVTHTHMSTAWRTEVDSRCRSALQLKAVLTVEQPNGQQGVLVLWGAALDWLPRFNRDRAAVWDFHILLVRDGLTSDLPELHSTPWSSVQPLDPTDRRVQDFFPPRCNQKGNGSTTSLELDLDTLLSQRHSGEVELRVQVTAFHFQKSPSSQNAPQPVMDSSMLLDSILEVLSGDVTYTGCGRCCAELDTDSNGIYRPCYPCLPNTAVRRYYRPAVLTVTGQGSSQVCVQVPPVPLQKILDAPPDKLHRISAPGSQVKHIQVAAERIQSLLSLPRKTFIITIRSHFLCDENSIPLYQDFTLLDFQLPS